MVPEVLGKGNKFTNPFYITFNCSWIYSTLLINVNVKLGLFDTCLLSTVLLGSQKEPGNQTSVPVLSVLSGFYFNYVIHTKAN